MNKLIAAIAFASLSLSGCFAGAAFSPRGAPFAALYADTKGNEGVTEKTLGAKTGEACATSILGLVTTGDASAPAAARAGGITQISSVDHKFKMILGIYAEYCLVVTGT